MSGSDSYAVLAERLSFPGSQRLRAILEHLLTPDVAKMVEALPGTATEVAEKTGFDADRVHTELDKLFFKGVVFPRGDYSKREYYRFARTITQFHDASQAGKELDYVKDRKFYELWQDFVMNEMYPRTAQTRQADVAVNGHPRSRVVPAYKSIAGLSDMLPHENYREMVGAQKRVAVVRCSCRFRTTAVGQHCDRVSEEETQYCLQFGRSADYSLARGSGRELSVDQAVALIDDMEEKGLVHMWANTNIVEGINTSCNCCRDCCMSYVPMDQAGLSIGLAWEKSRYAAYMASSDDCDGCQDCVDRCQFDAVEMVKVPGAKRMKATIDEEKCWGCGVCVVKCDQKALAMKAVRSADFIPAGAVAAE